MTMPGSVPHQRLGVELNVLVGLDLLRLSLLHWVSTSACRDASRLGDSLIRLSRFCLLLGPVAAHVVGLKLRGRLR